MIGGVFIILGLYCVLWGKSKETKKTTEPDAFKIISKESELKEIVAVEAPNQLKT